MGFSTGKTKKSKAPKEEDTHLEDAAPYVATKTLARKEKDRDWSPQQKAIFAACKGSGNLLVEALAGTGKTTTIVGAVPYLVGKILLCAFNKRIAEELKTRVGDDSQVHVSTLHSLGFRLVKRMWPSCDVDDRRGLKLALEGLKQVGGPQNKNFMYAVHYTAQTCKEVAPFLIKMPTPDDPLAQRGHQSDAERIEQVNGIGHGYGHFDGVNPRYLDDCCRAVLRAMVLAVETNDGTVDYSDMLFIPLQKALTRGEYDVVIVDEAQDMNRAQLELAQRALKEDGRIIVVGDRHQAIYGFRGADRGSMDRLREAFDCHTLPLTVTYRCPKQVVEIARHFVPEFECAESAPSGSVRFVSREKLLKEAREGDFVLSRLNAPLLGLCLDLIKLGKRAKVEGRDIGKSLNRIIGQLVYNDRSRRVDDLMPLLDDWERNRVAKAMALDDEARASMVHDQATALRVLSDDLNDVGALIDRIETMFEDTYGKQRVITCSTVHKAKGLEADRVFILADTFKGSWTESGGGEEGNLKYVAVTRAKKELIWVDRADTDPDDEEKENG